MHDDAHATLDSFDASALSDPDWAARQDAADPLTALRDRFVLPRAPDGGPCLYFAGHSLGPQPVRVRPYVAEELDAWATLGVEGHFTGAHPWMPYHELLTAATARLVGALPGEVVVMNTLTVNLHLMLVSFYRPKGKRFRILLEGGAFPSDRYALASQARWHGHDPAQALIELTPRPGEATLRDEDILATIARHGDELALILLGNCNYLTGQAFDMAAITRAGHAVGSAVGFDLAHGAGNLACKLHDDGPDFAVWCNYKYLNAGPGGLGGVFVHQRHAQRDDLPRLAGWWGHDKGTRFRMGPDFQAIAGAEGWQLSNPPILQLAALRAAMEPFDDAGMDHLRARGDRLTSYLLHGLDHVGAGWLEVLTPRERHRRGSMLTVRILPGPATPSATIAKGLVEFLHARGAIVDLRHPDVVRLTPSPSYVTFADVQRLLQLFVQYRSAHA